MQREDFIFNTEVYQYIDLENKEGENILEESTDIMRELEEKLSFYKDGSEVSLINKNAGIRFVSVSEETFEIVERAKYYSKITGGAFDITIAPLVETWKINSKNPRIPSKDEIGSSLELINYEDIILNYEEKSIMLSKEGQKIDLGGIAKGYIADMIIEFYKNNNVESAFINIGGNVKTLGKKDLEISWKVGILEPIKHSKESVCAIKSFNESIVTSGECERGFYYNDEYYHHILNPRTGMPAKSDLKSITLICDDSIEADALATPLFIMGKDNASNFMIANRINGIMITNDNKIIVTKNVLKDFILIKDYEVLTF